MIQIKSDPQFSERKCLVLCPKCKSSCREIWKTHTKSGREAKRIKRMYVVCASDHCRYDLAYAKQPSGSLLIKA